MSSIKPLKKLKHNFITVMVRNFILCVLFNVYIQLLIVLYRIEGYYLKTHLFLSDNDCVLLNIRFINMKPYVTYLRQNVRAAYRNILDVINAQ